MKLTSLLALSTLAAAPALAQETRQLDSHEHGVSTLELAIDGNTVEIALMSPGADIVGFEYAASSDADKDAVEAAIRLMLDPDNIVALPQAAECRLTEVRAQLSGDDHDDEGHDDHADDDHGDDAAHDDHGDEDEHDDHADDTEAAHSEFQARYVYDCAHADDLSEVGFPFFDTFGNAQEIEATYITATGAGSAEIERDAPMLKLGD